MKSQTMIEIANPACCKQVDMPYWKLLDFSKVSIFLYPILWKGGRYLRALVQLARKGGMCQSIGSWLNSAWTSLNVHFRMTSGSQEKLLEAQSMRDMFAKASVISLVEFSFAAPLVMSAIQKCFAEAHVPKGDGDVQERAEGRTRCEEKQSSG